MKYIIYLILICVVIHFVNKFLSRYKLPKVGSLALVSGGVKAGKTTFGVALAIREYRSRVRSVKINNFFRKLFKKPLRELPLLYSNIPLKMQYVPLTKDLLMRRCRFVYGSVIYVSECSLVADSQLVKNPILNEDLLYFNKLIGHETKGGCIIYDTQSVADCHYSIKRCLSEYFYVHHMVKWIPFFLVAYVQECRYSEDNSTISVSTDDIELHLRKVIIRKSVWKKFDCYCYSLLTDNLPVTDNVTIAEDLKCGNIVSFKDSLKNRIGGVNNAKKDN